MTYTYNTTDLTDTATGLAALKDDYSSINSDRESYAGALGFDKVREAVEEFCSNWSDKRKEQVDALDSGAQSLQTIIENYESGDHEGVSNLRSEG